MGQPLEGSDLYAFLELKTEGDWISAFPVLHEFRPMLELEDLLRNREHLIANRYHLLGLSTGDKMVCVAGVVIEPHVLRRSELRINDLATLSSERSKGLGQLMLDHVERFARRVKCSRILLYSRLTNTEAHRFYEEKAKYKRYGAEFAKELD